MMVLYILDTLAFINVENTYVNVKIALHSLICPVYHNPQFLNITNFLRPLHHLQERVFFFIPNLVNITLHNYLAAEVAGGHPNWTAGWFCAYNCIFPVGWHSHIMPLKKLKTDNYTTITPIK